MTRLPAKLSHLLPRRLAWSDPGLRAWAIQLLALAAVIWLAVTVADNAAANMARLGKTFGFGFLDERAGFAISQSLIDYNDTMSFGRVFVVGLLNSLLVAGTGIVLATLLGFLVGLGRLSDNVVVKALASTFVEITRNLPSLFQILFWYLAVLAAMPPVRQSWAFGVRPLVGALAQGAGSLNLPSLAGWLQALAEDLPAPAVFLNQRGLVLPEPVLAPGWTLLPLAALAGLVASLFLARWARRRREATGRGFPVFGASVLLVLAPPLAVGALMGWPLSFEAPRLAGFNFRGGVTLIPEFVALTLALSIYTAGFIAEIVRSGIQSVSKGQSEAAAALGLKPGDRLRLVVVPQALRVIVPPLTSQYLNLTKNSSLGIAIGYPDLFSVFAGTTLNLTGRAIEIIAMTMGVYLIISLATAWVMGWYNARVALRER